MSPSSSSSLPLPLSSSSAAAAVALVVGISLALESSRSSSSPSNGTSVATQATGHGPRATGNVQRDLVASVCPSDNFLLSLPSLCCRRRRCLLLLRRCCFSVAAAALSTSLPGNGKLTPASGAASAKQPAHTSCTLHTHGRQGALPEFPLQSTFAQYGACACACARVLEQHSRLHSLLRRC